MKKVVDNSIKDKDFNEGNSSEGIEDEDGVSGPVLMKIDFGFGFGGGIIFDESTGDVAAYANNPETGIVEILDLEADYSQSENSSSKKNSSSEISAEGD